LEVEEKIKAGAENLLKVFTGQYTIDRKVYGVKHKSAKPEQKLSRKQAEEALNLSNSKIANLKTLLKQSPKSLSSDGMADSDTRPKPIALTTSSDPPSPNTETSPKSPTWSLSELLQALEDHDRDSQWYIDRGNELCRLLGKYPGLKWELSWPPFIGRYFDRKSLADAELTHCSGERERKKSPLGIELRAILSPMSTA
jgi:hypothetical protein